MKHYSSWLASFVLHKINEGILDECRVPGDHLQNVSVRRTVLLCSAMSKQNPKQEPQKERDDDAGWYA